MTSSLDTIGPSSGASSLAKDCFAIEEAARGAIDWFRDNVDRVGSEEQSLRRALHRTARGARRLARASEQPLSVGVFGPSQTGKSYLMSTLGGRGGKLTVRMSTGEELDFLADINPGGGDESTGVVTRFGVQVPKGQDGLPVVLRLLTMNDLLRIFSTAYILNTRTSEDAAITSDEVARHLSQMAKKQLSGSVVPDFEIDVMEVRDYVTDRCGDKSIASILKDAQFWQQAADIGSRLELRDRAELFSVLWGGVGVMTETFVQLASVIERMNGAEIAYTELSSLIPRSEGIQDVRTVKERLGLEGEPTVKLRGKGGSSIDVPRPVVAALTAELQLPLDPARTSDPGREFLNFTDLLDFPGLRSPLKIEDPRNRIIIGAAPGDDDDKATVGDIFLRGKVDFLFRRYCEDFEINALVVLLKPSTQEVTELPPTVRHWIDLTHGETPQERTGREPSFFVGLSWFDDMFKRKGGEKDPSARFTTRIKSVVDFFSQAGDWPSLWTPGKPFSNFFWLYTPTVLATDLFDYDDEEAEYPKALRIRKSVRPWVIDLRKAYLKTELAQKHFADPKKAFGAALKIWKEEEQGEGADGGATYLAEQIARACTPDVKSNQVAQKATQYRRELLDTFNRFYVSDNQAEQIASRLEAADELLAMLAHAQVRDTFGLMLRMMQVNADQIAALYTNTLTANHEDDDIPAGAAAEAAVVHTVEGRFAREALTFFLAEMREGLSNARARARFGLGEEGLVTLVDEIAAASRREDLERDLREFAARILSDRIGLAQERERIAMVTADRINRFVEELTLDPALRRRGQRAEAVPLELPETATRYWDDLDMLWNARFRAAVEANAAENFGGETVDIAENQRLGALIDLLRGGSDEVSLGQGACGV